MPSDPPPFATFASPPTPNFGRRSFIFGTIAFVFESVLAALLASVRILPMFPAVGLVMIIYGFFLWPVFLLMLWAIPPLGVMGLINAVREKREGLTTAWIGLVTSTIALGVWAIAAYLYPRMLMSWRLFPH